MNLLCVAGAVICVRQLSDEHLSPAHSDHLHWPLCHNPTENTGSHTSAHTCFIVDGALTHSDTLTRFLFFSDSHWAADRSKNPDSDGTGLHCAQTAIYPCSTWWLFSRQSPPGITWGCQRQTAYFCYCWQPGSWPNSGMKLHKCMGVSLTVGTFMSRDFCMLFFSTCT